MTNVIVSLNINIFYRNEICTEQNVSTKILMDLLRKEKEEKEILIKENWISTSVGLIYC